MNKNDSPNIIISGYCRCCGSTNIYIPDDNTKLVRCRQCNSQEYINNAFHEYKIDMQVPPLNNNTMRNPTPEERESVDKYIESISKPTGVNIFNLYKEEKEERCHVCGGIKRFGICQDCGTDS